MTAALINLDVLDIVIRRFNLGTLAFAISSTAFHHYHSIAQYFTGTRASTAKHAALLVVV